MSACLELYRRLPPAANQPTRSAIDLSLIKPKAGQQIGFSQTEDPKRHASFAALWRIRFFACSQSVNFAFPLLTARSASRSACSCHAGDSKRSSSCERSAQSALSCESQTQNEANESLT